MTPDERWQRVQSLCEQAELLPAIAREDFLRNTEPDESIRQETLAMLRALTDEAEAQRSRPPMPVFQTDDAALPEWIGPYRVKSLLGQGGTGTVYAAEIDRAGVMQTVAVKVLHAPLSVTESAFRFRREQNLLAKLDHPGIARILDVGVTQDQRPYLVMEAVQGLMIDQYCDQNRLDVRARVQLMLQVCEAVQAAHRSLIVHLDLKPSNLLVTTGGRVKLLDFGTAKLLEPFGSLTTTRQLTPIYASPEQLRGEPVSTSCDVYSLGLVLYEVLAGSWPFGARASLMAVAERAAGKTQTRTMANSVTSDAAIARGLSVDRLRYTLRGDLEVIVSKAIAAEPSQRYESVAALSEDLERYLNLRPVLAQRQTRTYRLKKYAARNRGSVAVTALLLAGILSASGYAWWQQSRALKAAQRAQAVGQILGWMIQSSNPVAGGKQDRTVLDMIERAEERVQRTLTAEPALAGELLSGFGNFLYYSGKPQEGIRLQEDGVAKARASGDPLSRLRTLNGLFQNRAEVGRCPEAIALANEADQVLAQNERSVPPADLASYMTARGMVASTCEKDAALQLRLLERGAVAIRLVPDNTFETEIPPRIMKAFFLMNYGMALMSNQKTEQARTVLNEGLALARPDPDLTAARISLLRALSGLEAQLGNYPASEQAMREAVPLLKGSASPLDELRLRGMWASRLVAAGDAEQGVRVAQEVLAEAEDRAATLGPVRWTIVIDAMMTHALARQCGPVPELAARADRLSGGQLSPAWRANRLGAEGICLLEAGRKNEARVLLEQAIGSGPIGKSRWRQTLADALIASKL